MAAVFEQIEKSATELAEAHAWALANKATIPASVYNTVMLLTVMRDELLKTKQRATNLLQRFRIQLGVIPKSERGSPPKDQSGKVKLSDEERLAKLKERRTKLLKEIRRYEDRLGKRRKKRQKSKARLPKLASGVMAKQELLQESEFSASQEPLFSGHLSQQNGIDQPMKIDRPRHFLNPRGLHTSSDDRSRHEFGVTTTTYNLKVETVTDLRTGQSVTASTDEIGPPNSQATWVAIANAVIAIIGYAIPINRLATMLTQSNAYFTSSRLCSFLELAANMFLPIYEYLGEALADADVLLGDDTKGKVLEIDKHLADGGELDDPPEDGIVAKLSKVFGRVFPKKRGKGIKNSLMSRS